MSNLRFRTEKDSQRILLLEILSQELLNVAPEQISEFVQFDRVDGAVAQFDWATVGRETLRRRATSSYPCRFMAMMRSLVRVYSTRCRLTRLTLVVKKWIAVL